MKITDLVNIFKANKATEKTEYALNVHKAFAKYLEIDPNADIHSFVSNITKVNDYYITKLTPFSVRNYLRLLKESSTREPLISLLTKEELSVFSTKVNQYVQDADKKANEQNKAPKQKKEFGVIQDIDDIDDIDAISTTSEEMPKQKVVSVTGGKGSGSNKVSVENLKMIEGLKSELLSKDKDIQSLKTDVLSKDNDIQALKVELNSKENAIQCLKIENEGKNKQIMCLSNEIEFLRNLVTTLCKQHHT
jgi:hypothetical protein